MKKADLHALIDQLYADMPDFLKTDDQKGRGAFQLRLTVQDALPADLSDKQWQSLMRDADRRIAGLFGMVLAPVQEGRDTRKVSKPAPLSDDELLDRMVVSILHPFEGTSDGSEEGANYKARIAKDILRAFLDDYCPRLNPTKWAQRSRLRKIGEAEIENARLNDRL